MGKARLGVAAAAAALSCLAAGAAAAAFLPGVQPAQGSIQVSDILTCVPPQIDFPQLDRPEVTRCLEDTLYASIEQHGVRDTDVLMKQAQEASPLMAYICHDVSHTVGKRALPLVGDLGTALAQLPQNSCNNGLMHGFADQAALESPSEEQMRAAVKACEDIMGVRAVDCADALGHLFWTTSPQVNQAASKCLWFTSPQTVRTCTTGVIMRMVSPQPGTNTPVHTPQQVLEACQDWPVNAPGAARGCALGLTYAVYATAADSFQDPLLDIRENGVSKPALDAWIATLAPGRSLCEQLGDRDSAARCITGLGDNLYTDVPDVTVLRAWCKDAPQYAQPLCLTRSPDADVDARLRPVSTPPQQ